MLETGDFVVKRSGYYYPGWILHLEMMESGFILTLWERA